MADSTQPGDLAAALSEVVAQHGAETLSKPAAISNLLKDLLPDDLRMARVVVAASEERIADHLRDLLAQGISAHTAATLAASKLAGATMFPPEACSLVVSEIGAALNLLPRTDRTPTAVVLPEGPQTPAPQTDQTPGEAAGPATVTSGRSPDLATPAGELTAPRYHRSPASQATGAIAPGWIACLASERDGTVSLIDLTDGTQLRSIPVGRKPRAIAVTPDGATACVANYGDGTITLINISTARATATIRTGKAPRAIAITPDGATAYVASYGDGTITPINMDAGTPRAPIKVCKSPRAIAIDPSGTYAYVVSDARDTITPVVLAAESAKTPVTVGRWPFAVAITPDGSTAYIASNTDITPISLTTRRPGPRIPVSSGIKAFALTPDGTQAYLAQHDDAIVSLNLAAGIRRAAIMIAPDAQAIAITPDGTTAFVLHNAELGAITPVNLTNQTPGPPISVGNKAAAIALINPQHLPAE